MEDTELELDTSSDLATEDVTEVEPEYEANDEGVTEEAAEDSGSDEDQPKYIAKVDGKEVEVTLDELLNGYQRQSDYTRKTQELATERQQLASLQQLQAALNDNPSETLHALREYYGVEDADPVEMDPLEREVKELKAILEQQREQQHAEALEREATQAMQAHGLNETPVEDLYQFALERQIGDLNTAAELLAVKRANDQRIAERNRTTERKRRASVVEGGSSLPAGTTSPVQKLGLRESIAAALGDL